MPIRERIKRRVLDPLKRKLEEHVPLVKELTDPSAPHESHLDYVPPDIADRHDKSAPASDYYQFVIITGDQTGPDGEQGAYAVANGKSCDVSRYPLPCEPHPKAVFFANGYSGMMRSMGPKSVLVEIPDHGLWHFRRQDVSNLKPAAKRIRPMRHEPEPEVPLPEPVEVRPENVPMVEDLYDPHLKPGGKPPPRRGAIKVTGRLVKREKDGKQQWALVSRKDPSKVLKWFGERHPSDAAVQKEEARVDYFKHKGSAHEARIRVHAAMNSWVDPSGKEYEFGGGYASTHDRWALANLGKSVNNLLDEGWIRVAPPDAVQVRALTPNIAPVLQSVLRSLFKDGAKHVWLETDEENISLKSPADIARLFGKRGSIRVHAMPMPTSLPPGWRLGEAGGESYHVWAIIDENGNDVAALGLIATDEPKTWSTDGAQTKVSGYGAYLYEVARKWVRARGGHFHSDSHISDAAARVWDKFHQREDVNRVPMQRRVTRNELGKHDEVRTEPSLQYKYSKRRSPLDGPVDQSGIRLEDLGEVCGLRAVLVDGRKIRDPNGPIGDDDWTMGGNSSRYGYVPDGEVWVEKSLGREDRVATIIHEVTEFHRMQAGEDYDTAHKYAAELETKFRKEFASEAETMDPIDLASWYLDQYEGLSHEKLDEYKNEASRKSRSARLRVLSEYGGPGKLVLPPEHQVGMVVPKGGTSCANCEFLDAPQRCRNEGWQRWSQTSHLPVEPDSYCCDFWASEVTEEDHEKTASYVKVTKVGEDMKPKTFVRWKGLDIAIEARGGEVRWPNAKHPQYVPPDWVGMGYFVGLTEPDDGDSLDVIVGPEDIDSHPVFLAIQADKNDGHFRQWKVFLGFKTPVEVEGAFRIIWRREMFGGVWTVPSKMFRRFVLPRIVDPDEKRPLDKSAFIKSAMRIVAVDPNRIEPPHAVKNVGKADRLVEAMRSGGWSGRPVLGYMTGGQMQALTGSHRIAAARSAGLKTVPVLLLEEPDFSSNELFTMLDDAADNYDRLRALEKLVRANEQTHAAYELMLEEVSEKNKARRVTKTSSVKVTAAGLVYLRGLDIQIAKMVAPIVVETMKRVGFDKMKGGKSEFKRALFDVCSIAAHHFDGGIKLGGFVKSPILRDPKAEAIFEDFDLVIIDHARSRPSARGWSGRRQVGLALLPIIFPLLGKKFVIPSVRAVAEEIRTIVAHELRHAADYAYSEVRGQGERLMQENKPPERPTSNTVEDNRKFNQEYFNKPSELKSWAGEVANRVWQRYGPEWTVLNGTELVELMTKVEPEVMDAIAPESRRSFIQRVVSELTRLTSERQSGIPATGNPPVR